MTIQANQSLNALDLRPHLRQCGYRPSLLRPHFRFGLGQHVAIAAFAHPPADARSACIAGIDAADQPSEAVVASRPLGAPIVLVCSQGQLQWWMQGAQKPERIQSVQASQVPEFFSAHARDFAPDAVYRAKTWGRFDAEHQLRFVDVGLMPLVEHESGQAIERLIERSVSRLKTELGLRDVTKSQGHWVLQSVFWLVSAKILRDKEVEGFIDLDLVDVDEIFKRVASHYNTARIPIGGRRERNALQGTARAIERFAHLGLVTTESLAYVYENALISKKTRSELATHSTPTYLVDYVVGKLRPWIEEIPLHDRSVFEPACGHAAFLVSAMRLLTELLPPEKAASSSRRRYLRPRLHGCDRDSFALEIARLSLTLTDIPNPDGWDLQTRDMFVPGFLEKCARAATVLLANPPFTNFTSADKQEYRTRGVEVQYNNKTAEMLSRTLRCLPPQAVFGVVVPQGLLHSSNAASLRELIATDFELREICLFPDKIFTFSDMESAIIIGRKTTPRRSRRARLSYRRVRERDAAEFKRSYAVTTRQTVEQARFSSADNWDMRIPDLEELWNWCQRCPRFEEIAEIGQGLTYKGRDLPQGAITCGDEEFEGAVRGFVRFPRGIQLHELPAEKWMNLEPEVILRPRHGTVVGTPQVLLNEAPTSREVWRLKALIDREGHPFTGRFVVVRPHEDSHPLEFFWALCNSPVANAYLYSHQLKRHNDAGVLRRMPVPSLTDAGVATVTTAARDYLDCVTPDSAQPGSRFVPERAAHLLLRVDAAVLTLYNMPTNIERQLLDYFRDSPREGVPFSFHRYYPPAMDLPIHLHTFLAITEDWPQMNERRGVLIRRKAAGMISQEEIAELKQLQGLATTRRRLVAPLPLQQLEHLRQDLVSK